jgi:exosortase H (IPTLxxWG-CTERM-specific)
LKTDKDAGSRTARFFLLRFAILLALLYVVITLHPVNDHLVVPLTAWIARTSGSLLNLTGERVTVAGTLVSSDRFSVNIENGCNGLETTLLLAAAVIAFPAPWKFRLGGLLIGFAAIQAINFARVISLFWLGAHHAAWFGSAHTVIWQSAVVLFGVALFLLWATLVLRWKSSARAR